MTPDRTIYELMNQLVEVRRERSPVVPEANIRSELWLTLRQHAQLEDPNRLDANSAFLATWVLTALLEMEKDAGRNGQDD